MSINQGLDMLKIVGVGLAFLVLWWNIFGILVVTEFGESWGEVIFWFLLSLAYSGYFTKDLPKTEGIVELYVAVFRKIFKHSFITAIVLLMFWGSVVTASIIYDMDYFKKDEGFIEATLFVLASLVSVVFLYSTQIVVSMFGYLVFRYLIRPLSSNNVFNGSALRAPR